MASIPRISPTYEKLNQRNRHVVDYVAFRLRALASEQQFAEEARASIRGVFASVNERPSAAVLGELTKMCQELVAKHGRELSEATAWWIQQDGEPPSLNPKARA